MGGDGSAYAALGLEPGAEPADVERAYKQLIKRHHPDREGGDATRAAEINRAYRELRGPAAVSDPLILPDDELEAKGKGWVILALAVMAALAVLVLTTGPLAPLMRRLSAEPVPTLPGHVAGSASSESMDQPIQSTVIERAVHEALRIGSRDETALLNASQACAREFRQNPRVVQLERCAAFDDTVVLMLNRDPASDEGPFSQLAVSRRQWNAASALSNDYLAVDGRLDRIRAEVELSMAAAVAAPPRPTN